METQGTQHCFMKSGLLRHLEVVAPIYNDRAKCPVHYFAITFLFRKAINYQYYICNYITFIVCINTFTQENTRCQTLVFWSLHELRRSYA